MVALIMHGGCHEKTPSEAVKLAAANGMKKYGDIGFKMLQSDASAKDVVEGVIKLLEDDPTFDAGTGSFYSLDGEIEMDAMIMDSHSNCGGVICIKGVQHPISVARKVMEETPHVLLSGEGAVRFARKCGFPYYDPGSEEAKVSAIAAGKRMLGDLKYYSEERAKDGFYSTVGIVALDSTGELAVGVSTGGIRDKMPGRVGDSPIPGAGAFCDAGAGAVATGEGEGILKIGLSRYVVDRYTENGELTEACKDGIRRGSEIDCVCGVVALSAEGRFSYAYNGTFMPIYANRK
jgi:L-asparaginase / beta-aspartyl-peptidase